MALTPDLFVDGTSGSDGNAGTLLSPLQSLDEAFLNLSADGQVIAVTGDNTGQTITTAEQWYNTSWGTTEDPIRVIGVASLAASITDTDFLDINADTLPIQATSGTSGDIQFRSPVYFHGIDIQAGDDITSLSMSDDLICFEHCRLEPSGSSPTIQLVNGNGTHPVCKLINCEVGTSTNDWSGLSGATDRSTFVHMIGGKIIANSSDADRPTRVFNLSNNAVNYRFDGVDLSDLNVGSELMTSNGNSGPNRVFLNNCKLPASYTIEDSAALYPGEVGPRIVVSQSTDGTRTLPFYELDQTSADGDVQSEGTIKISTDNFSYKLTLEESIAAETYPYGPGVRTPWQFMKKDDTSETLTVHVATSTGTAQDDEVYLEIFAPAATSTDGSKYDHFMVGATPEEAGTDLAAGTTWAGPPGGTASKMTQIIDPAYAGYLRWRVVYCRSGVTIPVLYVSPTGVLS